MSNSSDGGPRKALGRGLAALIPTAVHSDQPSSGSVRTLPIEKIRANRTQPRKEFDTAALDDLAKSIEVRGVLQPVIVRKVGDGYELVAGERRWRAAARAGLQEIPAVVKDLTDAGALEVALIENIQRQDLDPLEEAEAYARLIDEHGLTQERVAGAVGKSRAAVANALRLLKLPAAVLELLADGRLTAGHARALMTLDDTATQERLALDVVQRGSTVRETERKARMLNSSARRAAQAAGAASHKTPAELAVEERLQHALGTKVRLHQRRGKGRIEVFFHSLDELDALLDKMAK